LSSRKTITPNDSSLVSGIHILYSPNSTGDQPAGLFSLNSIILGGDNHSITANSNSTILGGRCNVLSNIPGDPGYSEDNVILGGTQNKIDYAKDSFIIGGQCNFVDGTNSDGGGGFGIINSSLVCLASPNSTTINVTSGDFIGLNNVSILGHNICVRGSNNFTLGANLSVFNAENVALLGDGRRPYMACLSNAFVLRYTNGAIFADYVNIKGDNLCSPLYGNLGQTSFRNRNVNYISEYGGTSYVDGNGQNVSDITGINLSVGFKSMPIIIGERANGPIFADWSGIVSGVVYRIPSNAIHIGYDNKYNVDDTIIGDHNIRISSPERSLDKISDPFSRRAIVIGADNSLSGNNQVLLGQVN
ncbi:hypothetical protein EBU71_22935, partial [bacterium]|nr:hypothetical protein [Candidatus Elulimicrobium humile]